MQFVSFLTILMPVIRFDVHRGLLPLALLAVTAACAVEARPPMTGVEARAVAHAEGSDSAPVHVIYFDDYVCDDCAKFSREAVEPLRSEWIAKGRARLTVVDLAWHRGSVAGAAAAWCADEQGQYWPMHTMLFERQEEWKRAVNIPARLTEYAGEMRLDTVAFAKCSARPDHQRRLDAAEEATRSFAIRGTPAFVVNGKLYYGSQEWGWVEKVLLANERGTPEAAPPPPFKVPTKRVVDSVRLRAVQDSLRQLGVPATP